jgi:hypothetical protein
MCNRKLQTVRDHASSPPKDLLGFSREQLVSATITYNPLAQQDFSCLFQSQDGNSSQSLFSSTGFAWLFYAFYAWWFYFP